MSSFPERMARAMRLDPSLFDEVADDPAATGEALALVVASGLSGAIGSGGAGGLGVAFVELLLVLANWAAWSLLSTLVAARLLPGSGGPPDPRRILRATGFATTPGLLRLLGMVPELREPAFLVAGGWMISALVIALRQAVGYPTTARAIGLFLLVMVAQAVLIAPIAMLAIRAG